MKIRGGGGAGNGSGERRLKELRNLGDRVWP